MAPSPTHQPLTAEDDDQLYEVQLSIARRADALARTAEIPTSLNLHCWLLAEAEVRPFGYVPPGSTRWTFLEGVEKADLR